MRTRIFAYVALSFWTAAFITAGTKPTIRNVSVRPTSPASGQQMFAQYCAACHGADGSGNGPAAAALKQAPADLTKLASRNGGKFPDLQVAEMLSVKYGEAHGSAEMPVWGNLFQSLNGTNAIVQMRITNLTAYIESLQAK